MQALSLSLSLSCLRSCIAMSYIIRRCIRCRSRGDLGSCKDPFTLNSTQIEQERGVEAVPCASNWCVKIIESQSIHNGERRQSRSIFLLDLL
ncbi:unnamed protein product [Trichogramma brassicae]|uniref:Secreted protein n=1 Tax=Trichogramma brassicae TaxID=86971 RepID=A0A6H5IAC8_9HYME|nr:unnamed protein product [Trichogramma brassicae]